MTKATVSFWRTHKKCVLLSVLILGCIVVMGPVPQPNILVDKLVCVVSATFNGSTTLAGRLECDKGANVASADEVTLGTDGNHFEILGTTTINHITKTDWQKGSMVVLQFDASVTVTHDAGSPAGTEASILLSGAGNFSATADDTLQLIYDGLTFREVSRTVI